MCVYAGTFKKFIINLFAHTLDTYSSSRMNEKGWMDGWLDEGIRLC